VVHDALSSNGFTQIFRVRSIVRIGGQPGAECQSDDGGYRPDTLIATMIHFRHSLISVECRPAWAPNTGRVADVSRGNLTPEERTTSSPFEEAKSPSGIDNDLIGEVRN
jgi:hypothetical protein